MTIEHTAVLYRDIEKAKRFLRNTSARPRESFTATQKPDFPRIS